MVFLSGSHISLSQEELESNLWSKSEANKNLLCQHIYTTIYTLSCQIHPPQVISEHLFIITMFLLQLASDSFTLNADTRSLQSVSCSTITPTVTSFPFPHALFTESSNWTEAPSSDCGTAVQWSVVLSTNKPAPFPEIEVTHETVKKMRNKI